MIRAHPSAYREQALKVERLKPELYRLLAAPATAGFIIGWVNDGGGERLVAASIWMLLSLAGWLVIDLATRVIATPMHRRRLPLPLVLFAGFVLAAPLSMLLNLSFGEIFQIWGIERKGLDALASMSPTLIISSSVAPVALWLVINMAACRINGEQLYGHDWSFSSAENSEPLPDTTLNSGQPRFLAKVRPALRGRVIAINAELHYIRVFTDRGEDLIHYRFRDAVADLEAFGGLQVHRSWCVSASEIVQANAQSIELTGGLSVPVGRVYKDQLKTALRDLGSA